jgi:hypothetical protein
MNYGTRTDHYPATSKLLHWLVAACVLTTAPVAILMTRVDKGPTQDALFVFHKSLGVLILILMILRLINVLRSARRSPSRESPHGRKALPRSCNSAAGEPITFFGLFNLPRIVGRMKSLEISYSQSIAGWAGS